MTGKRRLGLFTTLFCASAGVTGIAVAQQDFSAVEVTVHAVAGNVHYLAGSGGNVGVLAGEDGVLMVDDQFAPLSEKLTAAIRTLSDAPIRIVVNTHIHGDHNGGNENFAAMGAMIFAHDNVRLRMVETDNPRPPAGRPVVTYGDRVSLHVNGERVDIIKVPAAHTDGDSIVYFMGSNVIHAGDVFRTTGYPGVDAANGGTVGGTLAALDTIIAMAGPDTRILPGHGDVSTREDVIEFRDLVAELERRISALIEQGMTLEQVTAANPTADLDERWGSFARSLPGFYEALSKEQ